MIIFKDNKDQEKKYRKEIEKARKKKLRQKRYTESQKKNKNRQEIQKVRKKSFSKN